MLFRPTLTERSSAVERERHFRGIRAPIRLLGTHQARSQFPDLDYSLCGVLSGLCA